MKTLSLIALAALALAGCAANDYKQYLDAQTNLAKAGTKPLLVLEAQPGQSITGLKRLEVNAPSQAGMATLAPPKSEWAGVVRDVGVAAIGGYVGVATTGLIVGGVKHLGDNIERSGTAGYPYVQAPQPNMSIGGSGVIGTGSYSSNALSGTGAIGGNYTPTTMTTDNHTVTPAPVVVTPVVGAP